MAISHVARARAAVRPWIVAELVLHDAGVDRLAAAVADDDRIEILTAGVVLKIRGGLPPDSQRSPHASIAMKGP